VLIPFKNRPSPLFKFPAEVERRLNFIEAIAEKDGFKFGILGFVVPDILQVTLIALICQDDQFEMARQMVNTHPELRQLDNPRFGVD